MGFAYEVLTGLIQLLLDVFGLPLSHFLDYCLDFWDAALVIE